MWRVQLFKLNYDDKEFAAVKAALDLVWITMDGIAQNFEKSLRCILA